MTSLIEEKNNPLLNRKEVIIQISSNVTPSYVEVEKIISEKFKVPQEVFKIKKIEGKFGTKTFKIFANIYQSKKDKELTEIKSKKEKEAEKKAMEEAKRKSKENKSSEKSEQ